MKIAMLAPFEESVPPKKYGGTELVVYNLTEGLVKRGYEVHLLASGDSKTSAKLEKIFDSSIRTREDVKDNDAREKYKSVGINRVINWLRKHEQDYDIVHNHIGWRMLPFIKSFEKPFITTLHGPLNDKEQEYYQRYRKENFVSISRNQRNGSPKLNYISNVYNGIDFDKFEHSQNEGDYLAFLGRMSSLKGPVQAIEIAKKAGIKLKMAAKIDLTDREYYEDEIKPLIDGYRVEYIGEIGHYKKVQFLKNAMALLAPVQWEEPFGLYFVEAMACGTPVIAFKRGSVPEVIDHGLTGFHCDNVDDAVRAIKKISSIDRSRCMQYSSKKFNIDVMVENYIKSYEKVLGKQ